MRYAIVTKASEDGTYSDVGTNTRRTMRLGTPLGVMKRCLRTKFCKPGDKIRIELFQCTHYEFPINTIYHEFT